MPRPKNCVETVRKEIYFFISESNDQSEGV